MKSEIRLALIIATVSGLAGMITGWMLPCLLFGALVYLGWHLYQLVRLPGLLRDGIEPGTFLYTGLWKEVVEEFHSREKEAGKRESNLTHSLDRLRQSVKALPEAVVLLGSNWEVEWSNPAAGALLGIPWPESSGKPVSTLVDDPLLSEYLDRGEFSQPLVFTSPAIQTKVLSLSVTHVGEIAEQWMIVAFDISRQYHLDSARREFVASLSHELRTPLTVLAGLLEQTGVIDAKDDATMQRVNELMQQQVSRMSELVKDLLTLSRLELDENPPGVDSVPVPDLLSTIVEEARSMSAKSKHVVQLDIASSGGLRGDAKELRTAFSNLVNNAVRHTPDRAEIRVLWMIDDTGAHFSVTDTGEGIPARHIPRLTERLYRVEASRSRSTGGTGLGLAIVKHVLERHGAELEITSSVGRGSTFTCHFPLARVVT